MAESMQFARLVQQAVAKFHADMPLVKPVDDLINNQLLRDDAPFADVLITNAAAGLIPFDVAPNQGKLLKLLALGVRCTRVLEIGTLGGYSTIWLAQGVTPDGLVVTIERDPHAAAVAAENVRRAGLANRVQIRNGVALEVLAELWRDRAETFDLMFIDADKENDVEYMKWALKLCRPGGLVVVDNVIRFGGVLDPGSVSEDPGAGGSRDLLEFISTHPRLDATAIQTVGEKGWDGFALVLIGPAEAVSS